MFEMFKKLKYGARVLLSRKGGEPELIDLRGRPVSIMSGGEGPPFVYLHSTLGESMRWLPFHAAWSKRFTVYAPIGLMILVSIVLTILLNLFLRR